MLRRSTAQVWMYTAGPRGRLVDPEEFCRAVEGLQPDRRKRDAERLQRYLAATVHIDIPGVATIGAPSASEVVESIRMPRLLGTTRNSRSFWMYSGAVFETREKLDPLDVKALVLESENKVKLRLARARFLMEAAEVIQAAPTQGRETIPDDVKVFVWNRDGGKCVKCGSNRDLEFDHIIPVSMGGSNTARNLQLLCEPHNRQKGGNLV